MTHIGQCLHCTHLCLLHPVGYKKYFDLTVSKLCIGQKNKSRCSFFAILDRLKAKLFPNENLDIQGLISPRKIMCL